MPTHKSTQNTAVKPKIVIASIAILVVILVGLAWHFFGTGTEGASTRPLTHQEQADQDWVQQKAAQTKGNFDQLSPEEQRRLTSLYGPKAPFKFRMAARNSNGGQ